MFVVNTEDNSIYVTRGDILFFSVQANDNGQTHIFQPGDIVRINVTEKKACENVVLQKDFLVSSATDTVEILLTEKDTKIGETISKAKDYWYEVVLNPETNPQTIIGYDDDGPKIFKLFPEGDGVSESEDEEEITPEDIPFIDDELDVLSDRPVRNKAIAREVVRIDANIKTLNEETTESISTLSGRITSQSSEIAVERARISNIIAHNNDTTGNTEMLDGRVDGSGKVHDSIGEAIRATYDDGVSTAIKPVGFSGIFGTYTSVKKGKTNTVQLTPNNNGPLGVLAWVGTQSGNKYYKVIVDSSVDFDFYVRNDELGTYENNIDVLVLKKENTVIFKPSSDFNVITFKLKENISTEISFSLYNTSESPLILPSQISDKINGFNHNILCSSWLPIVSANTRLSDYDDYISEYEFTPQNAGGTTAMYLEREFEPNTHYRLTIQGLDNTEVKDVLYGTKPSWGVGSYATIQQTKKYNAQTDTTFIDFVITNNDVGAKCLMLRFTVDETVTFKIGMEQISNEYEIGEITSSDSCIAFCGDSLTAQQYYGYISSGSKNKVGFAVGGEWANNIFARTGVNPLYYTSPTIENGTNEIKLSESNLFAQGMGNINPVTIAGIKGNLSVSNGKYYFTPSETIESVIVYKPLVIPYQATLNIDAYVYWIGTNGMSSVTTDTILNQWKKVLSVYPNALIVGLTKDYDSTLKQMVSTLDKKGEEELGSRYIAIHDWIVKNGLAYCGLSATDEDTAAININQIPPSLLADNVHFNEYGKRCVAHLVEERLKLFKII